MKSATLITGLTKQRILRTDHARYYHVPELRPFIATDGEMFAPTEMEVTERVVPITHFCRPGHPDLYIAYSEEVEELLGVPIRVILKEKDAAISELHILRSLTAWQHVKAAWKLFVASVDSRGVAK